MSGTQISYQKSVKIFLQLVDRQTDEYLANFIAKYPYYLFR